METRQSEKLQIPVQIANHVVKNNLQKPFAIYLYLKFNSSGKIHEESDTFTSIKKELKIKDNRTYKKHFQSLIDINWVGYNEKSGYYHVRGFDRIRYEYQFKGKQAVTLYYYDLKKLDDFLNASLICASVNAKKFVKEVVKRRKLKPVANNRDATMPAKVYAELQQLDYYGCSLPEICKLLGCKKTRASQLRTKASKAGFIKTKHKFTEILRLNKPDYNVRKFLNEVNPKSMGKIRFRATTIKGVAIVIVSEQTTDEIIPKLHFKTINKFNNLVVAPQIKMAIDKRIKEASKKVA